jgi:hypothetical protein
VPLRRFREAGVLDLLLRLTRSDGETAVDVAGNELTTIKEMDADDLVRHVLGDSAS